MAWDAYGGHIPACGDKYTLMAPLDSTDTREFTCWLEPDHMGRHESYGGGLWWRTSLIHKLRALIKKVRKR